MHDAIKSFCHLKSISAFLITHSLINGGQFVTFKDKVVKYRIRFSITYLLSYQYTHKLSMNLSRLYSIHSSHTVLKTFLIVKFIISGILILHKYIYIVIFDKFDLSYIPKICRNAILFQRGFLQHTSCYLYLFQSLSDISEVWFCCILYRCSLHLRLIL